MLALAFASRYLMNWTLRILVAKITYRLFRNLGNVPYGRVGHLR